MTQANIIYHHLLFFFPINSNILTALIGGGCAFVFAYLLTFLIGAFCRKVGWLDRPAARRVHTKAVPRLGGVAIFIAFFIASRLFYSPGPNQNPHAHELTIYWLLIAAGALMVIVHAYDDVMGLKPLTKLIAQTVAVLIILAPWGTEFNGILIFTFNNPFGIAPKGAPWYLQPTLFLFTHDTLIGLIAIPAVLFTWFWVAGMMNTVNLIDGLDGLATGVVAIAALFITIISFVLPTPQYSIAILSAIFTGATLGFLPHNWNPAKIFMGDSGSMFLGLGLAVLSIMGGAKIALAIIVLGVPILDVAVVMINRIRRGQSPLHYDKTHLHYRLMATGLNTRQICLVFYGLTFLFGLLALSASVIPNAHFFKLVVIGVVVLTMAGLVYWIDRRQRRKGVQIKLGGPEPKGDNGNSLVQTTGVMQDGRTEHQEHKEQEQVTLPLSD
jgi:UDP-GlcNAc:undecaprenyl-phosphate/decaprenyl-phosphate GlcNAc-1-phosphate transferase